MPRLSKPEASALAILSADEWMPGLEVVLRSETLHPWWSRKRLRRGTVYIVLDRLVEKGLVERWRHLKQLYFRRSAKSEYDGD
jgi:predicted transcriptional regulator